MRDPGEALMLVPLEPTAVSTGCLTAVLERGVA
jgi:hypothetical protein